MAEQCIAIVLSATSVFFAAATSRDESKARARESSRRESVKRLGGRRRGRGEGRGGGEREGSGSGQPVALSLLRSYS